MTPARCNTVCLLVMALALSLTALALVALACGPSAPAEQDDATPTPEPTETPTPTHQAEVSPLVNALISKQTAIAATTSDDAARQQDAPVPRPARVYISLYNSQKAAVEKLLTNQSAPYSHFREFTYTSITDCGSGCTVLVADVPVSLLPALAQHPGIFTIHTLPQYQYHEEMDPHLNLIVARYDAGLTTVAEAVAEPLPLSWGERFLLAADFDTSANAASAIRYLKDNGVYLMEHPPETTVIGGFIPVSLILPLSQRPGVIAVTGIGYGADLADPDVQKSLNRYKPPRPTSAGGPVQGQAPAAAPLTPAPMRRQFLTRP